MGITFLIIIGLIVACWIIKSVVINIKERISKRKFKEEAERIAPSVKTASENLESLFNPSKNVSWDDIDIFMSHNKNTIDAVENLYNRKETYYSILSETGIDSFKRSIAKESLSENLNENNKVYSSIHQLKELSSKAVETYKALVNDNHYFTYSEMKQFKQSLKEVETLSEAVLPKYEEYLGDEEKGLLSIYNNIDAERNAHNQAFIQKELADNKTYFDTVLGQYPLDPQQRDSLVKLEDNCLVIASAGSGKTSTILGKAKYLMEKRNVDPSKVLLITYTRKAANELHERMKIEGITCSTFHALAYQIIAKVTGQAPSICEDDVTLNIFHKLIVITQEERSTFILPLNPTKSPKQGKDKNVLNMSKYKDVLISNPSILSIITQNVIFVNEIIIKKKTIYIFFSKFVV